MAVKIGIRADGGQKVGMGHLMRCLSLAQELRLSGHEAVFFSRRDSGTDLLEQLGFRVQIIEDRLYPEQELPQLKAILSAEEIDTLIIDTYAVNACYFCKLQEDGHLLIYIDDINAFPCPADIVVNGNVNAGDLGYQRNKPEQVLLLGAQYNLLRSEYRSLPVRQLKRQISDIMLTTGGSDPCQLTPQLVKWLLQLPDKRIHTVVGAGFGDKKDLVELQTAYPERIILYENLTDLSSLMLRVDLAVSSGGSTLYQLASSGTPVLAFIMADNQAGIVDWLSAEGYITSLGWHQHISNKRLTEAVVRMEQDLNSRQLMAQKGQLLIDGKGPARVIQAILKAIVNKEATKR